MSPRATLGLIVVVVLLIMFAPVAFAALIERFFEGLGTMLAQWT